MTKATSSRLFCFILLSPRSPDLNKDKRCISTGLGANGTLTFLLFGKHMLTNLKTSFWT